MRSCMMNCSTGHSQVVTANKYDNLNITVSITPKINFLTHAYLSFHVIDSY
jgi:hypothetical protein